MCTRDQKQTGKNINKDVFVTYGCLLLRYYASVSDNKTSINGINKLKK